MTMDTRSNVQPTGSDADTSEDAPPIERLPWLTARRAVFFVIGWLVLFSIGSLFIANPFDSEPSAGADPVFWHVMYLHGLLIGMVGLLALLACWILELRAHHTRAWIVGGVVFATIVTAIGGIFDRQIPGAEVAMWVQILGFFALDEILIVLMLGMWTEWRAGAAQAHALPFVAAFLGAGSMFVAAIMGHLAGWILEFGNFPSVIGSYANLIGVKVDDFSANLIGSHSHEMVVGVMAVAVSIAAVQFGYRELKGGWRTAAQVGLTLVGMGAVLMTIMYVVMGFTAWGPPNLFTTADGANGIAGDDIVTGLFVMLGGLVTLIAVVGGYVEAHGAAHAPVRLATLWSWVLLFATVVVAGYAIEENEVFFGAGDKAPGAANDAVYTWLHQDIGLFLLPALIIVMLAVARYVVPRYQGHIAWATAIGTTVTFIGGMIFVFVNPALHGPGYDISTVGLLIVGIALLATLWYGVATAREEERLHLPGGGTRPLVPGHAGRK